MIKKTFVKSKSCYKVTFSLPKTVAKNATEVKVLGEFNDWEWDKGLAMKANKTAFTAQVELPGGRDYQFRYLIDNTTWENDWNADAYVASPFTGIENSVVACPSIAGVPVSTKNPIDTLLTVVTPKTTTKAKAKVAPVKTTAKKETTTKATTSKVVATKKTVAKKTVAKKVTTKKTTTVADKAVAKMKAKGLQVIEGVGPKIEKLMNEAGLFTFQDVAKAPIQTLKDVLKNAGPRFRMHNPETWTEQAQLAHEGKWNELITWQGKLKGGRK